MRVRVCLSAKLNEVFGGPVVVAPKEQGSLNKMKERKREKKL